VEFTSDSRDLRTIDSGGLSLPAGGAEAHGSRAFPEKG
jgi:hypothetical protein